ncbi:hypothetical protein ACOMHN_002869 [Nucella lapillus]
MNNTITKSAEESSRKDDESTKKDNENSKRDEESSQKRDKNEKKDGKNINMNDESTKKDDEKIKKDDENINMNDESTKKDDEKIKKDDESTKKDDEHTKNDDENTKKDDENTKNDDVNTETGDVNQKTGDDGVYAPDGGWGWMVTLAGFLVAFITDGIVTSFGLMLPDLLDTFGSSLALTSLPPGIMVASFLISSPMTAYLVQRWGCRLVGLCGGVIAALGVAASAFAPNIHLFILGFGLVAGVGVGLIYLPSITMVNAYFHKKRGMVAGIITSGSGFGLLALAPLTEILMEEYGWRGCYLIMAAITLNFCVCASLMRPLRPRPPPSSTPTPSQAADSPESRRESEDNWCVVSVETLEDAAVEPKLLTPTVQLHGEGQSVNFLHKNRNTETNGYTPHLDYKSHLHKSEFSHLAHETHPASLFSSLKNLLLSHRVISAGSHVAMSSDGQTNPRQGPIVRSRSHGYLEFSPSYDRPYHTHLHDNALSTWLACQVPPSLSRHSLLSHQSSDNMAGECEACYWQKIPKDTETLLTDSLTKRHHHHHDGSGSRLAWGRSLPSVHVVGDIRSQDVDGSHLTDCGTPLLHNKASSTEETDPYENQATCSSLIQPGDQPSQEDSDPAIPLGYRSRVVRWLKAQMVFILFLLGAFLIQLICYVPPLLTPSYAYQNGVSKEQVATILSIYGVLNTAGRLLAGVCVYCGVRSLHVYNLGTLLSAVACFTFPFSTSFPTIALTLGLHGFFLGAFPPLQSVILVEYLGLDRLASTFGIMCLVKAFGVMAGAPLAGLLYTLSGTYTVPVTVCGAVLILAVISHQLMDCCP